MFAVEGECLSLALVEGLERYFAWFADDAHARSPVGQPGFSLTSPLPRVDRVLPH